MFKPSIALATGAIVLAGAVLPPGAQAQANNAFAGIRPLPQGPARWLADYRFLKDPARRTDPLDALRYHELGQSSWLTLGGDMRYIHRTIDNPNFGLTPFQDDSFLMQRLQLHADLHLFDDTVRAFLQVQNTSAWGAERPTLRDGNGTDIAQAFVDLNFSLHDTRTMLRIGRQEILYGQGALFNIGDLRNVRLAWDGVRSATRLKDGKRLELVAIHPIEYEVGAMNNDTDDSVRVLGAYGTLPLAAGQGLDAYAFTRNMETRAFQGAVGEEDRHTFGLRYFGNTETFRWTWDVMGQTGEHAGRDIAAWGIRSHTQYKLGSPYKVLLGAHFDIGSGGDPGGSTSRTFDPLYPKNGEYGLAGVTTQANLILLGPSLGASPLPDTQVQASIMRTWRQDTDDFIYLPGMRALPGSLGNDERDIGTVYQIFGRWTPSRYLALDLEFMAFDAGSAVTTAGGKDARTVEFRVSASF